MYSFKGVSESNNISISDILSKVSEYDIFKYYCTPFKNVDVSFTSELRKDKNPSCRIYYKNGKLKYKDFGEKSHYFSAIDYVKFKYNLTLPEALQTIANDFNLKLTNKPKTNGRAGVVYDNVLLPKTGSKEIKIKVCNWSKKYIDYWAGFGVDVEYLKKFRVFPISHFWIGDNVFNVSKQLYFAYYFPPDKFKIYGPECTDKLNKWYGNCSGDVIQGLDLLPETGEFLVITKSYKDVIVLNRFGIYAIAPQSESYYFKPELVEELRRRFNNNLFVNYDLDKTGIVWMKYNRDRFKMVPVFIRDRNAKDFSDYIKFYGYEKSKNLILKHYDRSSNYKRLQQSVLQTTPF